MGGIMQQQQQPSMVAPEDDPRFVDDLLGAFGNDPVGQQLQQQQHQHMGQMPSHVYNQQQHLMAPPPSQTSNLLSGRIPAIPMTNQPLPMQQSGLPGSMHINQMGVGADGCIGPGVHQLPNMSAAPAISPGLGGHGISIQAPPLVAPRQQPPTAIVPTLATPKFSDSSRALTTSSNNGGSSDEDAGMGDGDDAQKKKERRRQQVRYASRRRRKKQKDEESFLRDRIAELREQIRIIGGDLTEQCSQMAGMSEQALTEAYEKQMVTVQTLRKDNNKLKEQLLQHENFARMIQYGLNALPSDCRDVDRKKIAGVPMWISDQMNPLKGPTLVVDLNLCHEAVRHAYNELKTFGPTVNSKTNVCYAMGWKTELWAASTCLNFRAVRSISDKNIREVANASWDIITCPEKCKRIYPDVKQFRILQKVTDDIVVVHRIASVASDLSDREFISVAFRLRDGDDYYIGLKSITVQAEAAENCTRGEECQGWMFVGGDNETSPWKAHFLGYYDVKGEKDDKVLNQLANESMFGMLRWESESMHPLSV
uniref:BZIP domain-containing protein n=1 Tax=Hyaloperonospora arabidopsidis (strain Emoy2) TaxID=559515 RepID=M4BAQ3_HYAAE